MYGISMCSDNNDAHDHNESTVRKLLILTKKTWEWRVGVGSLYSNNNTKTA